VVLDCGDWWLLSFENPGGAGTTTQLQVFPAVGLVSGYPYSSIAAVGTGVFYAPRICDKTAHPSDDITAAGDPGFTGAQRGQLGTLDVWHYVRGYATEGSAAESTRYPEVTDWPRGIMGQRA